MCHTIAATLHANDLCTNEYRTAAACQFRSNQPRSYTITKSDR
jgi:hypothetical protein